jgi:hypothetical protein
VGNFLYCKIGLREERYGELEFQKAKSLHGGVCQRGLKETTEMLFGYTGAFGEVGQYNRFLRVILENPAHVVQGLMDGFRKTMKCWFGMVEGVGLEECQEVFQKSADSWRGTSGGPFGMRCYAFD